MNSKIYWRIWRWCRKNSHYRFSESIEFIEEVSRVMFYSLNKCFEVKYDFPNWDSNYKLLRNSWSRIESHLPINFSFSTWCWLIVVLLSVIVVERQLREAKIIQGPVTIVKIIRLRNSIFHQIMKDFILIKYNKRKFC